MATHSTVTKKANQLQMSVKTGSAKQTPHIFLFILFIDAAGT
jgi:hypothetical protein